MPVRVAAIAMVAISGIGVLVGCQGSISITWVSLVQKELSIPIKQGFQVLSSSTNVLRFLPDSTRS